MAQADGLMSFLPKWNVQDNNDEIIYMSNFPMLIACKGTSWPVCTTRVAWKIITVRYFWHGFIHRGRTFMYLQCSRPPLFIIFCQMSGRPCTPSVRPCLLMFRIDRSTARISSSLVLYRVPRSGSLILVKRPYVCIFGLKGASTSQVIGARNEMMMDDYDGQMIYGDLVGLKLPDIRLTGEEKPRKNLTQETCPDWGRTRARCETSAHATTCSTAVDWRDRNRMDSYRVITMDVPESPISSGARGPWLQQLCDFLHCHEEWWGSVSPNAVVFSWVNVITISSPEWKNECEVPGTTQEMNLSVL